MATPSTYIAIKFVNWLSEILEKSCLAGKRFTTLPALELPCTISDEGQHVRLSISFPARVRVEWLLNLYIFRYEQEPFGVTLHSTRQIATRIIMRADVEPPGRAEWGRDQLFLILETEELDRWIYTFRRWYQGKWDMYTPRDLDISFDSEQTNLPGGLELVLGPGREPDPPGEPRTAKHRRSKHV